MSETPERQRLTNYLNGADTDRFSGASGDWENLATASDPVPAALRKAAKDIPVGDKVAEPAAELLRKTAQEMEEHIRSLNKGAQAIQISLHAIRRARTTRDGLGAIPASSPEPSMNSQEKDDPDAFHRRHLAWQRGNDSRNAAIASQEEKARQANLMLTENYQESERLMKEIHGIPDAEVKVPGYTGNGGGPGSPTPNLPTPSHPSPNQPTPSQPTPSHPSPNQPTPSQPTPNQPTSPGPWAPNPPVDPTPPPSGGVPQGPGPGTPQAPPSPSPTPPVAPSSPSVPSPGTPPLGGAPGSPAALPPPVIGGPGAVPTAGGSAGPLPARALGASGRAGGPGVVGSGSQARPGAARATGAGAGARAAGGRGTGRGAGGGGTRAAGAGAGARGGRGAGRGSGGAAGRGGRRGKNDERGLAQDLWDDGSDWIDDEGMGPRTLGKDD
ncbi:hypothetical protein [Nocardioides insulae]|uniref:hypothetical protein n=1 Tax=Nocardioides insulae TaxID=394734 RepID=UPI000413DE71|nr:hypothetical protein [Nocardioides insulae]